MPSDRIRVLHVTDPHLFADSDSSLRGTVTHATLAAVLDHYQSSAWRADLVAMTGDVIQDDTKAAYQRFSELLGPLELPTYCVPGNHDVREVMRETLATPPFYYCDTQEIGDWLIVGIDSCVDDDAGGLINNAEMDRLSGILSTTAAKHVAICLHHPPLPMGSKWLDRVGLRNSDEFLHLLSRSGKVRVTLFGHVHQEFYAEKDGIKIIGTPSTCRQFKPGSDEFALDEMPPAYRRIELFADGGVSSELIWVASDK